MAAGFFLIGAEDAPGPWLHSQHFKDRRRHPEAGDLLRRTIACQRSARHLRGADSSERPAVLFEIRVVGRRDRHLVNARTEVVLEDDDELIGFRKRQRPKQHAVHETEYCGVRTDADSESSDGDYREGPVSRKAAS